MLRYLHFRLQEDEEGSYGGREWHLGSPWDEVGGPRSLPRDIEGHDVESFDMIAEEAGLPRAALLVVESVSILLNLKRC